MTKLYMTITLLFAMTFGALAQITQVTDVNTSGDAGIASPYLYNGEIYFEADAGDSIGDELYKITAVGETVLVKNINTDSEDTSPNGDPKNFIEYNGKLYFSANGGDNTGVDIELFVTDGTEAGTELVYDFNPELKKGSNPMEMFVFNNNLYLQANDNGFSTQLFKYDGTNAPIKLTNLRSGGYASPQNAVVDEDKNIAYFQAFNDEAKYKLYILNTDDSYEQLTISGDPSNTDYNGNDATLFNGKLYFEGDNGTDGDQLWVTDGTNDGTKMLKLINSDGDANPADFVVYNDELYFVADNSLGTQLWKTDGTEDGTVMVLETVIDGFEASDLIVLNNKIFFFGNDNGVVGKELYSYNGADASLVKNIASVDSIDSGIDNFVVADGLLFFEATSSADAKNVLWVTEGTEETTVEVSTLFEISENPMDVNTSEYVVRGSVLYFTGDDALGDEIFSVDASMVLGNDITFTVTDNNGPIEGASVTFNGNTSLTDVDGIASFSHVRDGADLTYTVAADGHNDFTNTTTVDGDGNVDIYLIITSIEDDLARDLKVYPNPAKNFVNISNYNEFDSYRIFTMGGRVVAQGTVTSQRIDFNLNAGVYFIELRNDSANVSSKLVVE